MQTMAEFGIGLAAVAESYKVLENPKFVGDLTRTVAIFRDGMNASPALQMIERGQGFVAALWGSTVVVAVYEFPSAPMESLLRILDEIRNCVAPLIAQDVLILGDFNAKSTLWGSIRIDLRGKAVVDWAAELDLQLLNVGNVSTCFRWQGESIVDLSWAFPRAARRVQEWRVAEERKSRGDHLYIDIFLLHAAGRKGTISQGGD